MVNNKVVIIGLILAGLMACGDSGEPGGAYQAALPTPQQLTASAQSGIPGNAIVTVTANKFLHLVWKNPEVVVPGSSIVIEYKVSTESQYHVKAPISGTATSFDLDLGIVMNTSTFMVRIKSIKGTKESNYSNIASSSITADYSQYNLPTITGVSVTQGDLNVLNGWATTNYSQIQSIDCQSKPEADETWSTYPRFGTAVNPPPVNVCSIQGDVGTGYRVYRIMVTYTDGMSLVSNVSSHLITSLPAPTNLAAIDAGSVLTFSWDFPSSYDAFNTGFNINYSVYTSGSALITSSVYYLTNPTQRSYSINPCQGVLGAASIHAQIAAAGDANNIFGIYNFPAITSPCP